MGKTVESLVVEFDQAKYEEFLSSSSKSLRRGSTAKSLRGFALESALRSSQTRLVRRISWLIASCVTPTSTSPRRPAWLTFLMVRLSIPFLSARLLGVLINPHDVTGMLSDDRDGVRVNYRREKLEQLSAQ